LKNRLDLNIELASPEDFIPASAGWRERSQHIASISQLDFFHYDFAMQVLAKLERGHDHDLEDVSSFLHGVLRYRRTVKGNVRRNEPG
jgi:hypothetical protein